METSFYQLLAELAIGFFIGVMLRQIYNSIVKILGSKKKRTRTLSDFDFVLLKMILASKKKKARAMRYHRCRKNLTAVAKTIKKNQHQLDN